MNRYLITNKSNNVIIAIGRELDYMDNGYPRIVEQDVAFPINTHNVYNVGSVPEYVETEKYCYDELNGFYENPNYVEPREMEE